MKELSPYVDPNDPENDEEDPTIPDPPSIPPGSDDGRDRSPFGKVEIKR